MAYALEARTAREKEGEPAAALYATRPRPLPGHVTRTRAPSRLKKSAYLSPLQPELIDEDDAIALGYGEPCAIGAETQVSDDVDLRPLLRGLGGKSVSLFPVFVVQRDHSIRLFGEVEAKGVAEVKEAER